MLKWCLLNAADSLNQETCLKPKQGQGGISYGLTGKCLLKKQDLNSVQVNSAQAITGRVHGGPKWWIPQFSLHTTVK